MIEDFLLPGRGMLGGRDFNFPKIIQLSDEDFTALYLELMTEYRDKNGWWSKDKIPKCYKCHEIIPGPEDLVRSCGRSLHKECFPEIYKKERHSECNKIMRNYFDKVNQVICGRYLVRV